VSNEGLTVALLDVARTRISRHSLEKASAADGRLSTRRKAALELVAAFLVLMGIAIGILSLRFALVLMRGALH